MSAARRFVMTESQKRILKDFLKKPIAYFDVVIDDWKKSIVWKYFGELAYKDPDTGEVTVLDHERHYCLKCIIESQTQNQTEEFETSNVCFLSNGTATGNHKNHLRMRHNIIDETCPPTPRSAGKSPAGGGRTRRGSRRSNVMTISVEEMIPVSQNEADAEGVNDDPDTSLHKQEQM